VQQHLARVYSTLALTLLTTCVGVVVDLRFHLGGTLSAIAGILLLVSLGMQQDVQTRVAMLGGYGFLQGLSLGPLIALAIRVDPAILVTALLGTLTVFTCFSLSAIYSPRRSYLYLGASLGSALSFLCVLSLVSFFWRPVFLHSVELYFGLAVFCAFILYDTQLMIEKAELGSDDFVHHALELFLDFLGIFIRLLIILLENSQNKKKDEDKKKSRR